VLHPIDGGKTGDCSVAVSRSSCPGSDWIILQHLRFSQRCLWLSESSWCYTVPRGKQLLTFRKFALPSYWRSCSLRTFRGILFILMQKLVWLLRLLVVLRKTPPVDYICLQKYGNMILNLEGAYVEKCEGPRWIN